MKSAIRSGKEQILMGVIYKALFMLITSINALVIVKLLTPEELGIWYIFMALQTLLFILNSALTPNISRQYSIAFTDIGEGFDPRLFHTKIIIIYNKIILVATVMGVFFTLTYLNYVVDIFRLGNASILLSWVIVFASILLEIYFTSYECALNGFGEFKKVNKVNFVSRLILTLSIFTLLLSDVQSNCLLIFCGLYFFSNIIKRVMIINLFNHTFKDRGLKESRKTVDFFERIRCKLQKLSFLSLLSSIGGVLIVRSGMFILPFYVPMDQVASYGLTYQLFELGFNVIFTISIIVTPAWISAYKNNPEGLKKSFTWVKYISLLLMLICGLLITFLGNIILEFADVETRVQSVIFCFYLLVIFVLQVNHSISGQLLTIQNKIPFAYASFLSGIFALILSGILIKYYSVFGAIYAILISQLIYNNWKWPYEAYKFLRVHGNV
ncbi:hypothetical protein ABJX56_001613 [Shigella dysenteriae]|uniref:O-antigen flippase n=2 Tax=Shigella TaxID=620 RepID=A0A1S9J9G6_SHIBO|nr:hypothetical protein [Shigella boydii]EGD7150557.1 hypothetical protein [Shigella dysenteriae]MBA8141993.1 hypothetical protein [Escherichia coli]EGE2516956.1 hypothetical protein [Shigella dysenteriae]EHX4643641.1 hypothetical protein [Shigella dysenteriae]EHX5638694.1 hypothetical protein [Shigella dysenteriae]